MAGEVGVGVDGEHEGVGFGEGRGSGEALLLVVPLVMEVIDDVVDGAEKAAEGRLFKLKTGVAGRIAPEEKMADGVTFLAKVLVRGDAAVGG